MASRKQRRRRAKERRHEYEYVYVDEEGQEVELPPEALEDRRDGRKDAKQDAKQGPKPRPARAATRGPARAPRGGAVREVPRPSWSRVMKRGAIFAPLMLLTIYFLGGKNATWDARISQLAFLLVLFIPFSYLVDRYMYRRYLQQAGKLPETKKRGA